MLLRSLHKIVFMGRKVILFVLPKGPSQEDPLFWTHVVSEGLGVKTLPLLFPSSQR